MSSPGQLREGLAGRTLTPDDVVRAYETDPVLAGVMADILVERFPPDADAWLVRAWAYHREGRHDEAATASLRARELQPRRSDIQIFASRMAAADGRPADAERLLGEALARRSHDARLQCELGRRLVGRREYAQAIPLLRRAQANLGQAEECFWTYATALALDGHFDELASLQARMDELSGPELPPCAYYRHLALAKISLSGDRDGDLRRIIAAQASDRWLDARPLLAEIKQAIVARIPWSLIRMGDGEARLLCYLDDGVTAMLRSPERVAMLDSVWENWFGESVAASDAEDVRALGQQLRHAMRTASVVGIPDEGSIRNDHYHYGFFALMQEDILAQATGRLTPALVNHALHAATPFLADLLTRLPFIGFVGCHPDLAKKLAAAHGIAAHRSWIVPGENGRPALPQTLRRQGHFPAIYREVLATLEVPFAGAVFLVAAGVLGKIYCARITELGGIAIDIGSLADAWMGWNTRPGQYDAIENWRLP